MTNFVEFILNNGKRITVNIGNILNIFECNKSDETKICMGEEDVFSVNHNYDDVIKMINKAMPLQG